MCSTEHCISSLWNVSSCDLGQLAIARWLFTYIPGSPGDVAKAVPPFPRLPKEVNLIRRRIFCLAGMILGKTGFVVTHGLVNARTPHLRREKWGSLHMAEKRANSAHCVIKKYLNVSLIYRFSATASATRKLFNMASPQQSGCRLQHVPFKTF